MTPLYYGDLVIVDYVFRGIVLSDADQDHDVIPVAMADGTEQMLQAILLRPVPVAPSSTTHANFAEWVLPMALPIDRAINAFMGYATERGVAAANDAILALYLALTPIVSSMADDCFEEIPKRDYVNKVRALLRPR